MRSFAWGKKLLGQVCPDDQLQKNDIFPDAINSHTNTENPNINNANRRAGGKRNANRVTRNALGNGRWVMGKEARLEVGNWKWGGNALFLNFSEISNDYSRIFWEISATIRDGH